MLNNCNVVTNHNSLYFSDGNVAPLSPKSPQHYIAFRVHRSLLSKAFPVFQDLFELPQGEIEEYDGVPLVYLMDGADGLEMLLQLIYHNMYVPAVHDIVCTVLTCLFLEGFTI